MVRTKCREHLHPRKGEKLRRQRRLRTDSAELGLVWTCSPLRRADPRLEARRARPLLIG